MSEYLLKNAAVFYKNQFTVTDVLVQNGTIAEISPAMDASLFPKAEVFDLNNCFLFPGLVDVHVHFREPGFLYKETIQTGSWAGGARWDHACMYHAEPKPRSRYS